MNGFENACRVESEAMPHLVAFLEQQADSGRFVLTAKGRLARELQRTIGDAIANVEERVVAVEFKVEREQKTGNFFLETWSNLSRYTPGWMLHLNADVLLYYFLDDRSLYSLPFGKLRSWAFQKRRIYDFPEKSQKKYDQKNDTWGRCVPISVIEDEVGCRQYLFDGTEWHLAGHG